MSTAGAQDLRGLPMSMPTGACLPLCPVPCGVVTCPSKLCGHPVPVRTCGPSSPSFQPKPRGIPWHWRCRAPCLSVWPVPGRLLPQPPWPLPAASRSASPLHRAQQSRGLLPATETVVAALAGPCHRYPALTVLCRYPASHWHLTVWSGLVLLRWPASCAHSATLSLLVPQPGWQFGQGLGRWGNKGSIWQYS